MGFGGLGVVASIRSAGAQHYWSLQHLSWLLPVTFHSNAPVVGTKQRKDAAAAVSIAIAVRAAEQEVTVAPVHTSSSCQFDAPALQALLREALFT